MKHITNLNDWDIYDVPNYFPKHLQIYIRKMYGFDMSALYCEGYIVHPKSKCKEGDVIPKSRAKLIVFNNGDINVIRILIQ